MKMMNKKNKEIRKTAIIFHCVDNWGKSYKYAKICDNSDTKRVIQNTTSTEVVDYEIIDAWLQTEEDKINQAFETAKIHYREFCELVKGRRYEEIDNIVKENNFSYGSIRYVDQVDMVDINYKSILVTVHNEIGNIYVSRHIEIYDSYGMLIWHGMVNEL